MRTDAIYADGRYLAQNPSWHEEDADWKAGNIARIIARNGIEPTAVGEIGCGAGGVLLALARRLGPKILASGYEVSPQAYALCKARETENVKFFLDYPLSDLEDRFDVVLIIDVIEHLEDYFSFLRQVRLVGRHKIFHIPLDLSAQTVLRGAPLMKWRADVGHVHYFIKETALASLADTGYRIIDQFYTNTALELPNRGWRANLLKLPRKILYRLYPDLAAHLLGGFSLMVLAE